MLNLLIWEQQSLSFEQGAANTFVMSKIINILCIVSSATKVTGLNSLLASDFNSFG